jgi:predicted phage tail protein
MNPIQWINDRIQQLLSLPQRWQDQRSLVHHIWQQTTDPSVQQAATTVNQHISRMQGEYGDVTRKLELQGGGTLGAFPVVIGVVSFVSVTWIIYRIIKLFKDTDANDVALQGILSGMSPKQVEDILRASRDANDAAAQREAEAATGNPVTAVFGLAQLAIVGGIIFMVAPMLKRGR